MATSKDKIRNCFSGRWNKRYLVLTALFIAIDRRKPFLLRSIALLRAGWNYSEYRLTDARSEISIRSSLDERLLFHDPGAPMGRLLRRTHL
jgi:hypothetical protein